LIPPSEIEVELRVPLKNPSGRFSATASSIVAHVIVQTMLAAAS
jgi:hypothetical protein